MEFFGPKWPNFGQKRANFEFSTKKWNGHFFTVIKLRLHEKNQKNRMRHFENMSKKHWFGGCFGKKMANFGPFLAKKGPILNFRPKSETVTFFTVMEPQLHEKNQKNLMRRFLRKSVRTDRRMYELAWIHRSPRFLETKKGFQS